MNRLRDEYRKLVDHINSIGGNIDSEITDYIDYLENKNEELEKKILRTQQAWKEIMFR